MRLLGVILAMTAAGCAQTYPGAWGDDRMIRAGETYDSPEVKASTPFTRAVASWNSDYAARDLTQDNLNHPREPLNGCVQLELQAGNDSGWFAWQSMGTWGMGIGGASVKQNGDASCSVDTDTLMVAKGVTADRFRYRLRRSGDARLRFVAVTTWTPGDAEPFAAVKSAAWGKTIDVPKRSQMVEDEAIRGDICSATSLAMVLEHYGVKKSTRVVADGVYDHEAKIYGNWPLNTAYAAIAGMKVAYVAHFRSLADLEGEIAAGRPVIISHKWKEGELTGAPVAASKGHLIVVVGFTETGDVVVNDPAAHPDKGEDVRRTYPRREIYHTWLENASGIAYVIRN